MNFNPFIATVLGLLVSNIKEFWAHWKYFLLKLSRQHAPWWTISKAIVWELQALLVHVNYRHLQWGVEFVGVMLYESH